MKKLLSLLILMTVAPSWALENSPATETEDPYLWLEDVTGEKSLQWVEARNKTSLDYLTGKAGFESAYQSNLKIYNSDERIPLVTQAGDYLYNFWRDESNERGLLRRTTIAEYKKDKPAWEAILDIDKLAETDDENWVYKGIECRYPDYDRCLVSLSRGGADAVVTREFDLESRRFVKDGFNLPEAKSSITWLDRDTVFVGTDFDENAMTDSGYPRTTRIWKRGTLLDDAETIFEAEQADLGVFGFVAHDKDTSWPMLYHGKGFFSRNYLVYHDSKLTRLDIPETAEVSTILNGSLIVELKEDWKINDVTHAQGSVLSINIDRFLEGSRDFTAVIVPDEHTSVYSMMTTRDYLVVTLMRDVNHELYRYRNADGKWLRERIDLPDYGAILTSASSDANNNFFINYNSFLKPTTQYYHNGETGKLEQTDQLPAFFDSKGLKVEQYFATAADGVKVPYFVVGREDMPLDGSNPTLLNAYGGFEVSRLPFYSATSGSNWLDDGGIYVLANIRGGGEYGPDWHQAALKKNRHVAFGDFISVAEDLIQRKITSPERLGIMGGSNGGLLVGAAFTMRPELYNAVVCAVPLLDMKRYNKLLAGASWMAEYGNPDEPEMWEYIKTYSPYQNVKAGVDYPKVFFTTSTRDDRVHPGHARKMVARMQEQGHDLLYYENTEGGHAGASNNDQTAYLQALIYTYLKDQLMTLE